MAQPQPHQWVTHNPLPNERTPVMASQESAAGGSLTLALGGDTGKLTYMTLLTISAQQVAAVVAGLVTITGVAATLNLEFVETVTAGGAWQIAFDPPLPAAALSTAIITNVPAIVGGSKVSVIMYGYEV